MNNGNIPVPKDVSTAIVDSFQFPIEIFFRLFDSEYDEYVLQYVSKNLYHRINQVKFNFVENQFASIFSNTKKVQLSKYQFLICDYAFENNYPNLLKWAIDRGLTWSKKGYEKSGTFYHGNNDLFLKAIKNYKYPINKKTIEHLIQTSNINGIKMIFDNKYASLAYDEEDKSWISWLAEAGKCGNYDIFIWFENYVKSSNQIVTINYDHYIDIVPGVIIGGNMKLFEYLLPQIKISLHGTAIVENSINYSHLHFLEYIHKLYIGPVYGNIIAERFSDAAFKEKCLNICFGQGNVDIAIFLEKVTHINFQDRRYVLKAATHNQLDMVMWLVQEKGTPFDLLPVIKKSVHYKNFEMLMFITNFDPRIVAHQRANYFNLRDIKLIYLDCVIANLKEFIIYLAVECKFPLHYDVYLKACTSGKKDIAEWLRLNGCPTWHS